MKKAFFCLIIVTSILTSCIKNSLIVPDSVKSFSNSSTTLSEGIVQPPTVSTITYNNESSQDYDSKTNPRLLFNIPGSLNRTLWGTYDKDFVKFEGIADVTYTITVSNFDTSNINKLTFYMELYQGNFPSGVTLFRMPDGVFTASFKATESVPYIITLGDQNSDLNSGRSLGDYTVSVTSNGPQQSTVILSSLVLNPPSVKGGRLSTGTVSLSNPAPIQGVTVNLTSSNTKLANIPSSVFIASGNTIASFAINTGVVNRNKFVYITASNNNVSKTASLTITK